MVLVKNIVCKFFIQPYIPYTELICDKIVSAILYIPWLSVTATLIFGLATFNLAFPGVLLRWLNSIHTNKQVSVPRLLLPPALLLTVWLPVNHGAEYLLHRSYPAGVAYLPWCSLFMSLFSFLLTVIITTTQFKGRGEKLMKLVSDPCSNHKLNLRRNPHKRTRSGRIYGCYNSIC